MGSAPSERIDTPLQIRTVSRLAQNQVPGLQQAVSVAPTSQRRVIRDGGARMSRMYRPPLLPSLGASVLTEEAPEETRLIFVLEAECPVTFTGACAETNYRPFFVLGADLALAPFSGVVTDGGAVGG